MYSLFCLDNTVFCYIMKKRSGHHEYKKYKLNQIEDGVYQIQGYGSMLSGKKYPLEITIDNSQNQIKEIKQKNLDNQLETIYSQ